jgi:hypothetical protein
MSVDRQLLKRVLERYKRSLNELLDDETIRTHANEQLIKHLESSKENVDNALKDLVSLQESDSKHWYHDHKNILKPAFKQYEKETKRFIDDARERLAKPNLRELEIELARAAAELATLLNL